MVDMSNHTIEVPIEVKLDRVLKKARAHGKVLARRRRRRLVNAFLAGAAAMYVLVGKRSPQR